MRTAAELLLLNLMLFLVRCFRYVHEATPRRVAVDLWILVVASVAALWIVGWVIKLSGGLG